MTVPKCSVQTWSSDHGWSKHGRLLGGGGIGKGLKDAQALAEGMMPRAGDLRGNKPICLEQEGKAVKASPSPQGGLQPACNGL